MASAGQAGRHWPVGRCAIRSIAGLVSAAHENLTDGTAHRGRKRAVAAVVATPTGIAHLRFTCSADIEPPAESPVAEYTRRSFFVEG